VRKIIDTNYTKAETLLDENIDKLHVMAKALVKYETIDENQIKDIMEGREPRPPADWEEPTDPKRPDGGLDSEPEVAGPIGGPASEH
jgi:cell division protease FtsH